MHRRSSNCTLGATFLAALIRKVARTNRREASRPSPGLTLVISLSNIKVFRARGPSEKKKEIKEKGAERK